MAIKVPTASLFFDTRYKTKEGKYALKLNVHYAGKKKRYNLPFPLDETEWQKINSKKLKDTYLKEIKTKLDFLVGKKFDDSLKKVGEPFDFIKFENVYFNNSQPNQKNTDVYSYYQSFIDNQKQKGRVGNAQIYQTAMKTFKDFKKRLTFSEITPEFLQNYEKHMLAFGKSVAYISMNVRTLRSIYNQAITDEIIDYNSYPFSKNISDKKYKIKKGNNKKKALTTEQIKQLKNYSAKTPAQQKALDFWFFSFYCNGMNMKDICRLKYKNIIDNYIVYERAKTMHSNGNPRKIRITIDSNIQTVIEKYGNSNSSPEHYIFKMLKEGHTPQQERDIVQSFTRNINKHMKAISQDLKFDRIVSTYWARHSFATYLKRMGEATEVISELLGHSSVTTTENYLDSFSDETYKNTSILLSKI